MANSADQKPTYLDLHCLQSRSYPGPAGLEVKESKMHTAGWSYHLHLHMIKQNRIFHDMAVVILLWLLLCFYLICSFYLLFLFCTYILHLFILYCFYGCDCVDFAYIIVVTKMFK